MSTKIRLTLLSLAVSAVLARVDAQVTAPSTWASGIQVQGEVGGTEFDDWVGLPSTLSDPADNVGFIDIAGVQIANDDDYLYLHISYHGSLSAGTFIGVDIDQDAATGFDLFDLGVIGSEFGYENDYFFQQTETEYYLDGIGGGGPSGDATALLYPFWDQDGADKEIAIPRDLMLRTDPLVEGSPFFPAFGDAIDLVVFSEAGEGDITEVISYTFASAPEVVGDYNGDGLVNAADYTVWRDTDGQVGAELAADGNNDGEVDGLDYTVWSDNYGGPASGAAIPEPTSAALLIAGIVAIGSRRRG